MFEYIRRHRIGFWATMYVIMFYSVFYGWFYLDDKKFQESLTSADREHIVSIRERAQTLEGGEFLLMRDGSVKQVVPPGHSSGDIPTRSSQGTDRWLLNNDRFIWSIVKIVTPDDSVEYSDLGRKFVLQK